MPVRRCADTFFASAHALPWGSNRPAGTTFVLPLPLAAGIAAFAVAIAAAAPVSAQHGETAVTCTNPASGASWQIRIDYDRGTVDSNPASIGDAKISWHDAADGGNYTLDRKSGNLTVIVASSTGGYFLYDRCRPEN